MEKRGQNLGGAYVLAIAPHGETAVKILEEQNEFINAFYPDSTPLAKPFIIVSKFDAREEMEETLIRWLQKIIGQEQSFLLTLNNYSAVPPDTICLRLQEHAVFFYFLKKLEVLNHHIPTISGFFKRPYLAFASQLPPDIYERAVPHYSRKSFHESFIVNELLLMRKESAFEPFKTIQVFGLLPQSDLFNRVA